MSGEATLRSGSCPRVSPKSREAFRVPFTPPQRNEFSWGMRMRAGYAETVEAAQEAVSRWCEMVEALDEVDAQLLEDLGLSTVRVRSVLTQERGLALVDPAHGLALPGHGTVEEVEQMKQQVHVILGELATFETTLVEHGRDPYR